MRNRLPPIRCLGTLGLAVVAAACGLADEPGEPAEEAPQPATAAATLRAEETGPDEMTCTDPVKAGDTADTLRQRFGDQARVGTIYGPEGIELPGVALWPDDPKRRIEVVFSDQGRRTVLFAEANGASEWRAAKLSLGDPLAKAQEANAKPFELWGFSWDYGGYVSDFRGGKLAALPGGCRALLRFDVPEEADVPTEILGEVRLTSDDPMVADANARIVELALAFDPD